jgi:hypothetical protein
MRLKARCASLSHESVSFSLLKSPGEKVGKLVALKTMLLAILVELLTEPLAKSIDFNFFPPTWACTAQSRARVSLCACNKKKRKVINTYFAEEERPNTANGGTAKEKPGSEGER